MYPIKNEAEILTRRELEILQYVAAGHSSKQIASTLCISKATIDNHRKNMLRKTGAKNSNELVNTAYKQNS